MRNGEELTQNNMSITGNSKTEVFDSQMNKKTSGYIVTLLFRKGEMEQLWIPNNPEGVYYFDQISDGDSPVFLQGKEKKWYASCKSDACFEYMVNNEYLQVSELEIFDDCFVQVISEERKCIMYVEAVNPGNSVYHNYFVDLTSQISIGRTQGNDIVYSNRYVSKMHACIIYKNETWEISDLGSTNGTYVNGKKITRCQLNVGDNIYIMGLRIIVGVGFLSINDTNNGVMIASRHLNLYHTSNHDHFSSNICKKNDDYFNRLPHKNSKIEERTISIENPPLSIKSNQIPLMLRMGGSMVMSGASMLSGNYLSMISMVLFPVLTQKYTDKEKKEYEEQRKVKYLEYLDKKEKEIEQQKKNEEKILNEEYPEVDAVVDFAFNSERLWTRTKQNRDFMNLRIGNGELPMMAEVQYNKKRFSLDDDELEDKMYQLAEKEVLIENVPVMLSLVNDYIVGVLGTYESKLEFLRRILAQIIFMHGYDEVKIIVLADDNVLESIKEIRYIPHIWNDERSFRYIAADYQSAYLIEKELKKELETDLDKPRKIEEILKCHPYYVVFAFDEKIFNHMEILKSILSADTNLGISIMTFFDKVPKESAVLINLADGCNNQVSYIKSEDKTNVAFRLDALDEKRLKKSLAVLSNLQLNVISQSFSLPKMLTFLEMYNVGKIEQLNPLQRWGENNPVSSLAVPVGVSTEGSLFMLDLHEKYQGPHGLVAGMTGSGKSEFLITYILSLALNFHPDEVAFVLIDYKGGGLAGAFEDSNRGIHLPHLVGTITNLDGASIQRSLMSIESELKRRQRIFNEAKSISDEGTMDIYTYQKLYRKGVVSEPLPHLFIISDEFAELKSQEPEFMDQLISAARIGRSLGVHLILATQKPSGVVNDQINSNAKFRVCLKVQTRADSDEMIRRPDAAEIKQTGRFYLQVGYNELFMLGQSAWCGADYEPQEEVIVNKDEAVQFIDNIGQVIMQTKPPVDKKASNHSQLVAVVKYLSDLALQEHLEPRQLWMNPIPQKISLRKLHEENELPQRNEERIHLMIGYVDDPENQTQFPLIIDFSKNQNLMIVGKTLSGKTTALETILYTMVTHYSPEDINYYILDFSSRMLNIFNYSPYCGGCWGEGEEKNIEKFFEMLNEIIAKRKKDFTKASVNSYEAYCSIQKIPMIFIFVDNIAGLSSWKKGEAIYYQLNMLIREANPVGIKFIITAGSIDDVMYRIKKEFDLRLALSSKNKYEYGDILDTRCPLEPNKNAGRGMCKINKRALEMQIAQFVFGNNEQQRIKELRNRIEQRAKMYSDCLPAKKILTINQKETYGEFCADIESRRIPLGYSMDDIKKISIPLKQLFCMSIYLGNPNAVRPVLKNFIEAFIKEKMHFIIIKKNQTSIFDTEEFVQLLKPFIDQMTYFRSSIEDSDAFCKLMIQEINQRKKYRNQYCDENNLSYTGADTMQKCFYYVYENTYPLLIFFEDFEEFSENVSEMCSDAIKQIMKGGRGYNFYFAGCFEPKDMSQFSSNEIKKAYNPDEFVLLFGGQFNKQNIISLPMEFRSYNKMMKNYNSFMMKYHGELYPLFMPCGDISRKMDIDNDDMDIIG